MASPILTPRINNNDDFVRLTHIHVEVGQPIAKGQEVAEIETDKASFSVEAEQDGFLLAVQGEIGSEIQVGSVLMWIGESAADTVPVGTDRPDLAPKDSLNQPTLKALLLLKQYGLSMGGIKASGDRLTAEDVLRHVQTQRVSSTHPVLAPIAVEERLPTACGIRVRLAPEERGMLRTVTWQRDYAVPGYVEVRYDAILWDRYAADFQKHHRLLLNPLLSLFAYRIVQAVKEMPKLNATIVGEDRFEYEQVNLGFTVQSGDMLYMVVVESAEKMDESAFVDRLGNLQRKAMRNSLAPQESSGSTITFTSMARWNVSRHVPVLPPHNAIIVAHSMPESDASWLGASYDHRVLSGFDAVKMLQFISTPAVN